MESEETGHDIGGLTRVVIGIQARSGSKRFPRKVHMVLDGRPLLQHLIDSANRAAFYINKHSQKLRQIVSVAVVCPKGDEIVRAFRPKAQIVEGSEDDVLSRYKLLAERSSADYIVRITADCPLLPDHLIQKLIKTAVMNRYDYTSNVDPRCRTAIDGYDVEVMSRRALDWAAANARDASDREHVTQILRSEAKPADFKVGHVIGYLNQSHVRLTVDTEDDFERVKVEYFRRKDAEQAAIAMFGRQSVHRY